MNPDESPTFVDNTSVTMTKSYASNSAADVSNIKIESTTDSISFIHNGIT